ncbi:hypothetical protein RFI_00181 [Reticulomyxa filosa]|uniref:U-box domain-containing protein n=1 Tax=Reticulomyxa filosa TaxID=46433 RepID=X6PFC6_RETFI|nr:hypothetical protein RFI_00181 [Reticulomyxa filosa]|eukprot:ETO36881.1 hypothetical protein RFI_00181 [Reticulomyxa filosa]
MLKREGEIGVNQCISFNEEVLLCGKQSYSYHTIQKKYRLICSYPEDVQLNGHCVVQWKKTETKKKELQLLSFGGQDKDQEKQWFSLTYKSIWKGFEHSKNQWKRIPTVIGKKEEDWRNVHGLIGGLKEDLLFIMTPSRKIEVVDLSTFKLLTSVSNNTLPNDALATGNYECLVPWTDKGKKVVNKFLWTNGLSAIEIEFEEASLTFYVNKLCSFGAGDSSFVYAHVQWEDILFLFGETQSLYARRAICKDSCLISKVFKFSMQAKTWSSSSISCPINIETFVAVLNQEKTTALFVDTRNLKQKTRDCSIRISEMLERDEMFSMIQEKEKQIEQLKRDRPFVLPNQMDTQFDSNVQLRNNYYEETNISMQLQSASKETKEKFAELNEWKNEGPVEWSQLPWQEIWSCDGILEQAKNKCLVQMDDTSSVIAQLLLLRNHCREAVATSSRRLKQLSQTEINSSLEYNTKKVKKETIKKLLDQLLEQYSSSIIICNNAFAWKIQVSHQKSACEQKLMKEEQIHNTNENILESFDEFNEQAQKALTAGQKWMDESWSQLESKWTQWDSQQIATFIGFTLKCAKAQILRFQEIVEENKINSISLGAMSQKKLMTVFELKTFSQACLVYDAFFHLSLEYPMQITSTQTEHQETIPKEYLCPLSNSIMKDPVIALNGVTYDRSSIVEHYTGLPNASSLIVDGKLKVFPNYSLQRKLQTFLKTSNFLTLVNQFLKKKKKRK